MATRTPTAPVNDWVDVSANDWQDVSAGGAPAQPQKPAGNFLERALRPVDEALTEGSRMMYEGGKVAWNEPTLERKIHGVSQVLRGAGTALSPALAPAVLANPFATAGRVGLGLLAQKGVEGGAKAVGVPEGYSELAGDIAGAGVAGIGPLSRAGLATTARTLKGAATGAGEALANKSPAALVTGAMGAAAGEAVGGHPGSIIGGGIGAGLPAVRGAIRGGVKAYRNLPEQPRANMAPPVQTGSNNRTPLPAPPVTAAPPPVTGFRGAPPPRQQFAPPQQTGSNAPPIPPPQPQTPAPAVQWPERPPEVPPVEAGPPPLNWNKPARPPAAPTKLPNPAGPRRGPELPIVGLKNPAVEAAVESGPPRPPAPTPQAGPPPPPASAPQAEPPQPPQGTPESGTAYAAPEGSQPNYTAPKEHYMQAARTVRGKALGRLFRDEGTPVESFSSWKVGDPRWKQAAADAGVTPPNSPESIQAIIDEFGKLPPRKVSGTPRMATGGVIAPIGKERVRGMAHRWGPKGRRGQ